MDFWGNSERESDVLTDSYPWELCVSSLHFIEDADNKKKSTFPIGSVWLPYTN